MICLYISLEMYNLFLVLRDVFSANRPAPSSIHLPYCFLCAIEKLALWSIQSAQALTYTSTAFLRSAASASNCVRCFWGCATLSAAVRCVCFQGVLGAGRIPIAPCTLQECSRIRCWC